MPRCGWFGRLRYALGHAQWPGSAPSQCRPHRAARAAARNCAPISCATVSGVRRGGCYGCALRRWPSRAVHSGHRGRHCMALCALAAMLAQVGALESRLEALLDEAEMRRRQARVSLRRAAFAASAASTARGSVACVGRSHAPSHVTASDAVMLRCSWPSATPRSSSSRDRYGTGPAAGCVGYGTDPAAGCVGYGTGAAAGCVGYGTGAAAGCVALSRCVCPVCRQRPQDWQAYWPICCGIGR
jgi:hypothetical protein